MPPLTPARLQFAAGGVPWSADYGDVYHSTDGGPGQARHVFLGGNRLPERWRGRQSFVVLETGFGTGLNFLATWAAWLDDPERCARLHFVSVEKHPFRAEDLAVLHAAWPELAALARALRSAWPTLVPGCHRLEFEHGRVILTLLLGDARTLLYGLQARVDAIYLDGFAPDRNPEIWSAELFTRLARLAGPETTLATWSVAGAVRDGLTRAGFETGKLPGYGRKKAMLQGRRRPAGGTRPAGGGGATPPHDRQAIVIGAGLAGSACCERLAGRGWEITLVDRRPGPALAASGNPTGIAMPMLSRDDNIASRLSRAALLHSLRHWADLAGDGGEPRHALCGVLQMGKDDSDARRQRDTVQRLGFPTEFVSYLDADAAARHVGQAVPTGGWFFSRAGWASPAGVCRADLERAGARVRHLYGREAARLERLPGGWRVRDADDAVLADAPILILAGGAEALPLLAGYDLPMQAVRGQVSLVAAGDMPAPDCVVCRDGYATPAVEGRHCVGASYALDPDSATHPEDDRDNLRRLRRLLILPTDAPDPVCVGSRVGFRAVPQDRLPVVGQLTLPAAEVRAAAPSLPGTPGGWQLRHLPRQEGLFGLLGYASRGLIWATLMAEVLAAQLEGEPMPLEAELLAAIDPGRFLLRGLRRAGRA